MGVEDPRMDDGVARVKVLIFLQVDLGYQCSAGLSLQYLTLVEIVMKGENK